MARMPPAPAIQREDLVGGGRAIFCCRQPSPVQPAMRASVTHAFAALAFYTSGSSRIEQRGRWKVEAGDVLLVPAGQPHRSIEKAAPDWIGVGFCVPCLAAEEAGTLLEPFERVRAGASPVVRVGADRHAHIEMLLRELMRATESRDGGAPDVVQRSLLVLILDEVRQAARSQHPASASPGVVVDALRFIERNCLRPLSLKDVARSVGRSPAHVTTALSRATGRSAVEWIVAGRMAEARRILLHSDERVEIVAERVGYADATHFIRMFRREHGATPAAWRAEARSKGRTLTQETASGRTR
ncbi:helix-turn-helix domain-containing protein [Sorangium sp. So ce381]|uniref:helix-turn-helix domain-containing protein n=1 Tax=Sorangium sp. So ce381 TaxID=3133307 RepID=UPI003F5B325A